MASTRSRHSAQAPLCDPHKKTPKSHIPNASAPNALFVTDGLIHAGFVLHHGDSWWSFTPDGVLHGEWHSKIEAVRSLPFADYMGVSDVRGRP